MIYTQNSNVNSNLTKIEAQKRDNTFNFPNLILSVDNDHWPAFNCMFMDCVSILQLYSTNEMEMQKKP